MKKRIKCVVKFRDGNGEIVSAAGTPLITYPAHRGNLEPIELEVYEADKPGEFRITQIFELKQGKKL